MLLVQVMLVVSLLHLNELLQLLWQHSVALCLWVEVYLQQSQMGKGQYHLCNLLDMDTVPREYTRECHRAKLFAKPCASEAAAGSCKNWLYL